MKSAVQLMMQRQSDLAHSVKKDILAKKDLTISGPQVVPSAAGMNLVSHRCPVRWHQSDLHIS